VKRQPLYIETKIKCDLNTLWTHTQEPSTHQHLAVDIEKKVTENGGLNLTSGELRFYEGTIGFKFLMLF